MVGAFGNLNGGDFLVLFLSIFMFMASLIFRAYPIFVFGDLIFGGLAKKVGFYLPKRGSGRSNSTRERRMGVGTDAGYSIPQMDCHPAYRD